MKRLICTAAIGKPAFAEMALGLARSLDYSCDCTERAIITDIPGYDWGRYFQHVLSPDRPLEWIFFAKLDLLKRSDADQVLWVDSDCLAFQPLDPIFNFCAGKGFAVPGFPQTSGSYYGDIERHIERHQIEALPRVTAGMIYYERRPETESFIEQVMDYGRVYDSLGFERRSPALLPDEPCIALAMAKSGYGVLLPETLNFIHSAAGLVGRLTLDVARRRCEFACLQESLRYFRPILFHAWRYKDFLIYWRQLDRLKRLEAYADSHAPMHMSTGSRLLRSLNRKLLRLMGRGVR